MVYLRGSPREQVPNVWVQEGPLGDEQLRFRFGVIKLWEMDRSIFLDAEAPGLIPLAPLAGPKEPVEKVLCECQAKVEAFPFSEEEKREIWAELAVFAGLRYPLEVIFRTLEVTKMEESVVAQYFEQKGREKGIQIGEAKGEAKGLLRAIKSILEKQIGKIPKGFIQKLEAIQDVEKLDQIMHKALEIQKTSDLDDLLS